MKITALKVENFKRIEKVEIAPGDRALLILGGANRAGKSSVLDALSAALGGKSEVPEDPIKHGHKAAAIRVELDDGALVVERRITTSGTNTLEVRDANAKKRAPQKILDALVGARFLDPLKFAACDPKKQREMLLGVVDVGIDLKAWAEKRQTAYDDRTHNGREIKRLEGELATLPDAEDIGDPIDVDVLTQRLSELSQQKVSIAHLQSDVANAQARREQAGKRVKKLETELAGARTEQDEYFADLQTCQTMLDAVDEYDPAETERLQQQIAAAGAHNQERATARERQRRRDAAAGALDELITMREAKTEQLAKLDRAKVDALANVVFPVAGLGIEDGGVTYGGVPFSQASGAEQLRVSLSIAMALTPEIRDIWVRDGSLLDDDSLAAMRELAAAADCRVWLERVGDRDDDAIVIHDGTVAEGSAG